MRATVGVAALGLTLALLAASPPARQASAAGRSAGSGGCPRYELFLREASDALRRGDRVTAVSRLRDARDALDACARAGQVARGTG